MKHYLFILLSLFLISCSNQEDDTLKISLNTTYEQSDRGLLVLYPISELEDSVFNKITFPNLEEIPDTAFAQIYFTGNNESAIENGILVLVGDYTSESPQLWIDYNNDLNFLDRSEPILFSEKNVDVSISNSDNLELYHSIRFYKPDSAQIVRTNQMIEQYLTLDYPHVGYFFDERRNILVGDFIYEQDSLRIGVTDYNVNGQFNDFGVDRIVIGKYGGAIKGVDEASGAIILDSSSFLHSTNYSFEIIKVAGNGTSISIKPTTKRKSNNLMEIGKPISDYSFHLISGEKTSLHSFLNGQNYLYLNFWATWCAGCHQEITDLENLYRNYPNKVKIVSLNYEQDLKKVNPFIEKYKILWDNGFSTSEINDKLFIDGLPRNILIDPSGKIVAMNMHPSKLLELVDDL